MTDMIKHSYINNLKFNERKGTKQRVCRRLLLLLIATDRYR